MVDQTRMQESTPLFIAPVRTSDGPHEAMRKQQFSPISENPTGRPSAAGYISELPLSTPAAQGVTGKKGSILGPPPSSRRGASSFYSSASFVSPIIEESPHSRSHGSYASSAAMPEAWGTGMPRSSHGYGDAFYEESITDKSRDSIYDEYGDESRLMENRVTTKRAQAPFNTVTSSPRQDSGGKPINSSAQGSTGGVDSVEASMASWNASATSKQTPETSLGTITAPGPGSEKFANPFLAGNHPTFPELDESAAPYVPFSGRNSAIKRPPKLDIDAVRAAESRGSLTSLPDLIRRATRLAAMIDKGKRPSSRLDDLTEYLDEKSAGSRDRNKDNLRKQHFKIQNYDSLTQSTNGSLSGGRPPSGLSDMLAAFPPPVQTPQNNGPGRSSWLRPSSWPLVPNSAKKAKNNQSDRPTKRRRCCGMPIWAFTVVTILLLCVIVAAIVVPLEIFVFKNIGNSDNEGLTIQGCQKKLPCLNGGTSVVSQGSCSCICTGGFTGADCRTSGSAGCTTTDLISADGSSEIKNVTLGQAIPRLIEAANANFSLSLSGTTILAKINKAELSCIAQNSLVTFNGRSTRLISGDTRASRSKRHLVNHSMRRSGAKLNGHPSDHSAALEPVLSNPHSPESDERGNDISARQDSPRPFTATENALDFGRVSVLFVLQERGLDAAQSAQSNLQSFFTKVTQARGSREQHVSENEAANITLSGTVTANLVDFRLDIGNGTLVGEDNVDG